MAKASEIEKMFVGYDRGKVQVLEIYFKKERKEWTMKFKEGDGQVKEVGSEDRDFMEALFFEFGGNNPETCKTQSDSLACADSAPKLMPAIVMGIFNSIGFFA